MKRFVGSIEVWHKDGIVTDMSNHKEIGRVYINGELAKTGGKYAHVVVVGYQDKPLKRKLVVKHS